ncbi:hypothetical protein CQ12_16100 [Bradyrhizobium jicamae]|uniref:Uncharacterized protein n=1 Tax=Bradyrhizobium jicamae TaxID=280332 RepID=A0A0R3M5X4_9BRAD|nr:hypothetical protein [Bradyrhizobium jicamae]KRR15308.1 hypothetical protein CQ12_16100 [Bradyrhizobium jicamae]
MKRFLMITAATALLCGEAFAQQAAVMPTPSLASTSPLGMVPSAPVGGTGIPFGATEIASPGVSPMPIAATGTIGSTACSTIGTAPSTMFGSAATFDGGGVAVGTVTPQSTMSTMPSSSGIPPTSALIDTSGTSAMCGAGSSNLAASSTPTSPTTPGGIPRTGIPMGSTEIANLGVSSAAVVPTITVAPTISTIATIPTVPAITLPAPNTTAVAAPTDVSGIPNITGVPNTVPGLAAGNTMLR